jgi:hypothetical protein
MSTSDRQTETAPWPLQMWRRLKRDLRDMRVRHARERAELTAWIIEVEHLLSGAER